MVSHWSLSDSKFPQVSRTLLSILTDLNNAVVWTVSLALWFLSLTVLLPSLWDCSVCTNYNWYHRHLLLYYSKQVFHASVRSLSDSKSPQASRTLLSIPADLKNIVIWMVSSCHLISNSSSPFNKLLGLVPSAQITFGITVTFMFHCFRFF